MINVKLCMMVLLIELYLFKPLSVTFMIFQVIAVVKMLYGCYMHLKVRAQYNLYDAVAYPREIINMFLVSQVSGLAKNFDIKIFSDMINVTNVKLGKMVLFIELYLFIPLLVTFTTLQAKLNSFN